MNLPKPASWAPVLANLGLLAGMLLVAYEINQNSNLARMALVNEGNVASNQFYEIVMGEKPAQVIAMAVECPEALSYSNYMELDAFLFTAMNLLYRNYELAQGGIFTEEDWQTSVEGYTGWYLGNPFGRAWWNEEGREFFPEDEFTDYVDLQLVGDFKDSHAYYISVRTSLLGPGNQDNAVVNSSCPPE